MITAQQAGMLGGLQAGLVPMQAGALPATTAQQIDMNAIINMMMMVMILVGRAWS